MLDDLTGSNKKKKGDRKNWGLDPGEGKQSGGRKGGTGGGKCSGNGVLKKIKGICPLSKGPFQKKKGKNGHEIWQIKMEDSRGMKAILIHWGEGGVTKLRGKGPIKGHRNLNWKKKRKPSF